MHPRKRKRPTRLRTSRVEKPSAIGKESTSQTDDKQKEASVHSVVAVRDLTIHRNKPLKAVRRKEVYAPDLAIAIKQPRSLLRKRRRESDLEQPKPSKPPTSDELSGIESLPSNPHLPSNPEGRSDA